VSNGPRIVSLRRSAVAHRQYANAAPGDADVTVGSIESAGLNASVTRQGGRARPAAIAVSDKEPGAGADQRVAAHRQRARRAIGAPARPDDAEPVAGSDAPASHIDRSHAVVGVAHIHASVHIDRGARVDVQCAAGGVRVDSVVADVNASVDLHGYGIARSGGRCQGQRGRAGVVAQIHGAGGVEVGVVFELPGKNARAEETELRGFASGNRDLAVAVDEQLARSAVTHQQAGRLKLGIVVDVQIASAAGRLVAVGTDVRDMVDNEFGSTGLLGVAGSAAEVDGAGGIGASHPKHASPGIGVIVGRGHRRMAAEIERRHGARTIADIGVGVPVKGPTGIGLVIDVRQYGIAAKVQRCISSVAKEQAVGGDRRRGIAVHNQRSRAAAKTDVGIIGTIGRAGHRQVRMAGHRHRSGIARSVAANGQVER